MLEFLRELREVSDLILICVLFCWHVVAEELILCLDDKKCSFCALQVVTVGVVGGSDLVKISEQLGNTGLTFEF